MDVGPVHWIQFVRFLDALGEGWGAVVAYGILAGLIARFITAREARVGLLSASVLGIAGALLGFQAARWAGVGIDGPGLRFLAAFAGSMLLALLASAVTARRRKPPGATPSPPA